MPKRVCYIHVGPHKTGTTSIQWFLQENREELLKCGYFVPESETKRGAHYALVEKLCGLELGEHREPLVAKSIRALVETPSEAIVISSESLEGILRSRKHADVFFSRIGELNLEPKLILFPRNQPQWINSSYSSSVKSFRLSDPFQPLRFVQSVGAKFSRWLELANAHAAELIARPFTKETIDRGVIPEFLRSIDINSSQFRDGQIRQNEAAGPFTVSVARDVLRSIGETNKRLTWLQANRCKAKLAGYLGEKGLADAGYCGLTTALARHIEQELRSDNDSFAQQAWGRSWAEIFAADTAEEFTPNDFEMCRPAWFTARRLQRAIREMKEIVHEILLDPALAVEAPWNDVRQRSGRIFPEQPLGR
ncbi:MAG: hypothetical protein DME20_07050 [Verrucomicrobia bacterium]|nr:MAG: hypothetical protein DME92_04030 [Verrucomicrobiota bacterium]PYJ64160.1 MAG: hypothetical protein DME74_00795 [Verrucomicrobiota bacterium]PYK49363.1 MAG: hypothetical protein DME20_07050 [Verrucomicrobiota bacterium]